MLRLNYVAACLAVLALGIQRVDAQAPASISFQGFLADDVGDPIDQMGLGVTFTLYQDSNPIWTEAQSIDVDEGVFEVELGAVVPLDTVAFDAPTELGIKIDSEASEMNPRTALAAAPFARGLPGFHTVYSNEGANSGFNVVGGSSSNQVGAGVTGATIAGGGGVAETVSSPNEVTANFGAVGGGYGNSASGIAATVPGGEGNQAAGRASFAAGYNAQAMHEGSFVWNDRSDAAEAAAKTNVAQALASTAPNQFIIHAENGVGIHQPPQNAGIHLKQLGPGDEFQEGFGIRLEFDEDTDWWEIYTDQVDDITFNFNGTNIAWLDDSDGLWYNTFETLPVAGEPIGTVLGNVLALSPSRTPTGRSPGGKTSLGIDVDELEAGFPELVSAKGGAKGVSTAGLSIVAIKAIQELHEIVEQQQAEIQRLSRIIDRRAED